MGKVPLTYIRSTGETRVIKIEEHEESRKIRRSIRNGINWIKLQLTRGEIDPRLIEFISTVPTASEDRYTKDFNSKLAFAIQKFKTEKLNSSSPDRTNSPDIRDTLPLKIQPKTILDEAYRSEGKVDSRQALKVINHLKTHPDELKLAQDSRVPVYIVDLGTRYLNVRLSPSNTYVRDDN